MNTEKKANEIIDSYLYALVKKKGYSREDLLDALKYIVTGKVEYKNSGHPLEQLGTENIQKELFKSVIKKSIVEDHSGNSMPQHALEFIIMDSINKEGAKKAFKTFIEDEKNLVRLAEKYVSDHFEFDEEELFYSKLHEDMEQFMILKSCEDMFKQLEEAELLEDSFLEANEKDSDKEELLKNIFEDIAIEDEIISEIEEDIDEELDSEIEDILLPEEEKGVSTDMERLDYCLDYMKRKAGYKESTLIDVLNSALDGNYKVFTRENGIREIVEELPKEVLANKKALLLMKQMEEEETKSDDMLDL